MYLASHFICNNSIIKELDFRVKAWSYFQTNNQSKNAVDPEMWDDWRPYWANLAIDRKPLWNWGRSRFKLLIWYITSYQCVSCLITRNTRTIWNPENCKCVVCFKSVQFLYEFFNKYGRNPPRFHRLDDVLAIWADIYGFKKGFIDLVRF